MIENIYVCVCLCHRFLFMQLSFCPYVQLAWFAVVCVWKREREGSSVRAHVAQLTMSDLCIITLASIVAERGISFICMRSPLFAVTPKTSHTSLSLSLALPLCAVIGKVYVSTLWTEQKLYMKITISFRCPHSRILLLSLHLHISFAYDDCEKKIYFFL